MPDRHRTMDRAGPAGSVHSPVVRDSSPCGRVSSPTSAEGVMNRVTYHPAIAGTDPRPAGRHRERPRPAGAVGRPRWPQRQPGTHLPAEAYAGRHRAAAPNYEQLARLLAALRSL